MPVQVNRRDAGWTSAPAFRTSVAVGLGAALSACSPALDVVVDADTARTGVDGSRGPWGVGRVAFDLPVSLTERRRVEVIGPLAPEGDAFASARPLLVVLHGGFVDPARYRWLAEHAASRGYAVLLPTHRLRAALLEPGVAARARNAVLARADREGDVLFDLLAPDEPAIVAGHSLGGVAAARWWAEDPADVAGLALLASLPAASTPIEDAPARPVLGVTGDRDGLIAPEEIADGLKRFPGAPALVTVDGMNHFQWTDDARPGELRRDDTPTRGLAVTRRDALRALDAFFDAVRDAAARGEAP